jgi:non-specific serine/threonine protein kinase
MAEYLRGNPSRAKGLLEESLGIYREAGDRNGVAWCLIYLGHIAAGEGDLAAAAARFRESLRLFVEIEEPPGAVNALVGLSEVEQRRGHPQSAARLIGATIGIGEHTADRYAPRSAERILYDRAATASRAKLDDPNYLAAWTEGQHMTLDQAVAYALEIAPSSE